ncbi:hypothetical protein EVAR_47707_1 [Eumeta japonica]|uniref:Uncharacterized protein n=1 Tax=Eumeta variegata TaxID=151549 RepID=A0A4C1XLP9_EUMVA|nr:hypothetical protein EVAR_47707_1 [Eumeta japonica]
MRSKGAQPPVADAAPARATTVVDSPRRALDRRGPEGHGPSSRGTRDAAGGPYRTWPVGVVTLSGCVGPVALQWRTRNNILRQASDVDWDLGNDVLAREALRETFKASSFKHFIDFVEALHFCNTLLRKWRKGPRNRQTNKEMNLCSWSLFCRVYFVAF